MFSVSLFRFWKLFCNICSREAVILSATLPVADSDDDDIIEIN